MDKGQNGIGVTEEAVAYTLDTIGSQAVSYTERTRDGVKVPEQGDVSLMGSTGRGGGGQKHLIQGQGDSRDACAYDPQPDGPRYAACGDAVTVNVAAWIGHRLAEADA